MLQKSVPFSLPQHSQHVQVPFNDTAPTQVFIPSFIFVIELIWLGSVLHREWTANSEFQHEHGSRAIKPLFSNAYGTYVQLQAAGSSSVPFLSCQDFSSCGTVAPGMYFSSKLNICDCIFPIFKMSHVKCTIFSIFWIFAFKICARAQFRTLDYFFYFNHLLLFYSRACWFHLCWLSL